MYDKQQNSPEMEAKMLAEMRGERMHSSGKYESEMRRTVTPNRKARRASKFT